ncbi:hypothetical protein CPLU01_12368 [Colletotrichum plurivorum]|uniref:Zn(2)-C6 fungal-type domain-containing protein n=1 Tax=Colletotrichum plurivorum TaxID=2175906 RepID=A0A8H6N712_9PEZI|nr:hypothetical protein CPLU01_12368 [Colletotrichum plurivorum]
MAYNWNGIPQYFTPEDDAGGLPPDSFTMPNTDTFGYEDFPEENIPPASTFGSEASLPTHLHNTLAVSVNSQYQKPKAMPNMDMLGFNGFLGENIPPASSFGFEESLPAHFYNTPPVSVGSQYEQPLAMPQGEAMSPLQQVDPQAMAMVRLPPAIQQGQPLPLPPLPGVLGPNTQGARVCKPRRNKKAAAPAQGQKAPRKVKANACKRCRKKKISCRSANDQDPCDGCKADGSECDRSGEDMRTNKSTTTKYKEAVRECENLLAQLDYLAEHVRDPEVCPVALVKAIGEDATPLGEILERFFPDASHIWPAYIEPARQNYHLPAPDAGRKLLEYRGMFETLKNVVLGHIRALGGQQPSTLVTALASKASDMLFLGDLDGEDHQLRKQLYDSVVDGDNTILERLIFPPLERRVGAITHAHH